MRTIVPIAIASVLMAPAAASGQTRPSDRLAEQWREARRAELAAESKEVDAAHAAKKAEITASLKRLDADSMPAVPEPPKPAPPGPSNTVTTTETMSATAPDGSSRKTTSTTSASNTTGSTSSSDKPDDTLGKFAGLKFGVGVSFTLDTGDNDRVSKASVVNGVVRVDDEDNSRARIMLESHYFFTPGVSFNESETARWGIGPFVSLQPGSDNIIDAIGMGVMLGFRRGRTKESFNIGAGIVVDPNTRILGDDIVANQPLPTGETEVRYKERMQRGILILTSFSF